MPGDVVDEQKPWRKTFQPCSVETSRGDVLLVVQSFIAAFNDGSKQIAKNNALSEMKSRCQSLQFLAHLHTLPASVFSPVLDIVSTLCVDTNDNDSLRNDLVALLFDIAGGAVLVGYPTPPFAKVLATLVRTVVDAIIELTNADLEASFILHLQTLATCLRGNVGVKLFVSELPTRKELVRTLALLLNRTDDASILIYAMSVLACLVLHEPMGRKLFQPKNVSHALALVVSILDSDTASSSSMMLRFDSTSSSSALDTVRLQLASVNLVLDWATQPWILDLLETSGEIVHLVEVMLPRLHLHETVQRLHVALHFLHGVAATSHRLRKTIGSKCPPLAKVMAVVLHPVAIVAIAATKFFVALLTDDKPLVETLLDDASIADPASTPPPSAAMSFANPTTPASAQSSTPDKLLPLLQPLLIGLFRTLHATITQLVRHDVVPAVSSDVDHRPSNDLNNPISATDAYQHAVWICLLLVQLGADARIVTLSVPLINFSQLVGLAQREATLYESLPPEAALEFTPRFSLAFMALVGALVIHNDMDDDVLRECHATLQHPAVAFVAARGLCQVDEKQWTLRVLAFLRRVFALSIHSTKSPQLLPLADALYAAHQKHHDAIVSWTDRVTRRDAALQLASKQVDRVTAELDLVRANAADERMLARTEHARLQKELDAQRTAHEHVLESLTANMETQLGKVKAHCDGLLRQLQDKTDALEKKRAQLQDSRMQRGQLDQDNQALQRKLLMLEMRLDEVGEANAAAAADVERMSTKARQAQTELESMSEAYAAQSGDLLAARESNTHLKRTVELHEEKHESLYRQLVLLAKAHHQQTDDLRRTTEEREVAVRELQEAHAKLDDLHQHVEDQEIRIQSHKEHMAELERTIVRYEQSVAEEQARSSSLRHDLDMLRHQHVKMQNEAAAIVMQNAELQRQVDTTTAALAQRDGDVQRLKAELNKYAKIQAMIHQLSDGAAVTALSQRSTPDSASPGSHHAFVPETQFSQ
ncbi:hypothetical protein H310_11238 [Aphanomyces invadans]|uniref:CIP2A N-terminal domain-containing protein n=1 Tax=Aphanomyces invadans TaxID=157072 RepID=A0A024TMV2_9STRA|nr:hypothetical protein H310_11238 [Aphanomyces invadans]ETV95348.1 hypothetical protein H310_11238 [Aphanomyces invadans]|eukprot:XP_008876049.1 hypothetical protein H310_11238 [Aphanomyces invadans]